MHNDIAIQTMIDFVEGKLSIQDFKIQFDNNKIIKESLRKDPLCPKDTYYLKKDEKDIVSYINRKNWFSCEGQHAVWWNIRRFLSSYNYSFKPTKYYENRYSFLLDIQPAWLDLWDNEDFLMKNVVDKMPEGLATQKDKVKWCKEKIKELFIYDSKPPRWVQSPQWPIVAGKPLVFKGQSKDDGEDERVYFYFYDPVTGKETTITQLY